EITPKYYAEQRQHRGTASPLEIPLLGKIAAGLPVESAGGTDTVNFADFAGDPNTYALQVRGESMVEDHICYGDYVLVQRAETARVGGIDVALVSGEESTAKRIYRDHGHRVRLQPAHSSVEPISVRGSAVAIQ